MSMTLTQDERDELWNQLTLDERWCVWTYALCDSKADAARRIGKNPKWLDNRQRRNPAFRAALDLGPTWPAEDVARRMDEEIGRLATMTLVDVMRGTTNNAKNRVAAARIILRTARG